MTFKNIRTPIRSDLWGRKTYWNLCSGLYREHDLTDVLSGLHEAESLLQIRQRIRVDWLNGADRVLLQELHHSSQSSVRLLRTELFELQQID